MFLSLAICLLCDVAISQLKNQSKESPGAAWPSFSLRQQLVINPELRVQSTDKKEFQWQPFEGKTIALQLLGGIAATAISAGIAAATISPADRYSGLVAVLIVYPIGIGILVPTTVYGVGNLTSGNGSYLLTLLGGDALGAIYAFGFANQAGGSSLAYFFVGIPLATIVGSILAYNATGTAVPVSNSILHLDKDQHLVLGIPDLRLGVIGGSPSVNLNLVSIQF